MSVGWVGEDERKEERLRQFSFLGALPFFFFCLSCLLPSLLASFLASLLPCFLASLLPCFLASLLPCFLASLLPCFLASLLPCFLASSSFVLFFCNPPSLRLHARLIRRDQPLDGLECPGPARLLEQLQRLGRERRDVRAAAPLLLFQPQSRAARHLVVLLEGE
eukprot:scaffold139_cov246-Pinguiococcus_pyrenoidosus.AAC.1